MGESTKGYVAVATGGGSEADLALLGVGQWLQSFVGVRRVNRAGLRRSGES